MKMLLLRNYVTMMGNSIKSSSRNVLTQLTFSSIIALGLMSFIIPSDVTLASTSMISQVNNIDDVLINRNSKNDPFRGKREVDQNSDVGMDYHYERNFINDTDYHDEFHQPDITFERGPWESGPMKTISDSLFSLIILIYVSVIFVLYRRPNRTSPRVTK